MFALHIVLMGRWSRREEAVGMATAQLFSCGLTSLLLALPGGITVPSGSSGWMMILYLAVVTGALMMLVQTWSQSQLPANRAAIALAFEPVFAALWSVLFFSEPVTWRLLTGGSLMLAGMLIVELRPRRRGDAPSPEELPHPSAP